MNPSVVLQMIRLTLDALLLTLRQRYPPQFHQAARYKPGTVTTIPEAAISQEARQARHTELITGDLMTCFHKTISLLLFSLVPKDQLREYQPDVKGIADLLRGYMTDWATARSLNLIGHYYQPQGLDLVLVEDLPDIDHLIKSAVGTFFVAKTLSVAAGSIAGDEKSLPVLADLTTVARRLDRELSTEMFLMRRDPEKTVLVQVPLWADDSILGWAEVPIAVFVTKDDGPLAGEEPPVKIPQEPADVEPSPIEASPDDMIDKF